MTIQELIDCLTMAAEELPNGMESEVKIASHNYRSMMRYGVGGVAIADQYAEPGKSDEESICWIVEGGQDRDRPYSVPELEPVTI